MDPSRIRRLTMRDAMLLIAAAGIGLAVFQVVVRTLLGGWFRWENLLSAPPRGWTAGILMVRLVEWIAPSLPFAAAWTFAVPVLRLLPPRPSVRRVLRQPGTTACLAAIFGLLWAATGLGETLAVMRLVHGRVTSPPLAWCFHFVVEEAVRLSRPGGLGGVAGPGALGPLAARARLDGSTRAVAGCLLDHRRAGLGLPSLPGDRYLLDRSPIAWTTH